MKPLLPIFFLIFLSGSMLAQSIEIMPGTQNIFADLQWLKPLDKDYRWSLFSRTRATVDYENQTNMFSGAYLNYTTKSGFGASAVGRIASRGGGGDLGVHFFKASPKAMMFAIILVSLEENPSYSWFSIMRYTPPLNKNWKLYSSLELFSRFRQEGHVASVQAMRLGVDRKGYQFGLGINLTGLGADYGQTNVNPGLFVRKQF